MRSFYVTLLLAACVMLIAASQGGPRYQIASAGYDAGSKSKVGGVWRLDTQTGEICIYSKALVPGMQIAIARQGCIGGEQDAVLSKLPGGQ